jgi:hypothetical protein
MSRKHYQLYNLFTGKPCPISAIKLQKKYYREIFFKKFQAQ